MPRYFFDIDQGHPPFTDSEGTELPDLDAACEEALAVLPALAKAHAQQGGAYTITVQVRDEGGGLVFRSCLSVQSERLMLPP